MLAEVYDLVKTFPFQVGKFGQYWQCECNKGWSGGLGNEWINVFKNANYTNLKSGNGIQCMDSNGTLSAMPGQQVEAGAFFKTIESLDMKLGLAGDLDHDCRTLRGSTC